MSDENRKGTWQELKILGVAGAVILVTVAFIVTTSFVWFLNHMEFKEDQLREAAPYGLFSVLLVSFVSLLIYGLVRYLTVIRPLRKIDRVLDLAAEGDFSQRIQEDPTYGNFYPVVRKINRMIGELESNALMKTDFISNISHELKTPLAVMQNYGSLLRAEDLPDAERREYADGVVSASNRMSELITNILRLNRLETHQLYAKKEPIDLTAQLGECLLQFETVWEENEIDLQVDLPDEFPINSDPELLPLIWNNLLSNAFKFTEPGGTVSIHLTGDERTAAVSVGDSGCGMDAETGSHIFDKFYQGDTSHATQGNGLGLALVSRVIAIIEGEISVDSELGKGTVFTVNVPRNLKAQEE